MVSESKKLFNIAKKVIPQVLIALLDILSHIHSLQKKQMGHTFGMLITIVTLIFAMVMVHYS